MLSGRSRRYMKMLMRNDAPIGITIWNLRFLEKYCGKFMTRTPPSPYLSYPPGHEVSFDIIEWGQG
jgi:hypothetical protein